MRVAVTARGPNYRIAPARRRRGLGCVGCAGCKGMCGRRDPRLSGWLDVIGAGISSADNIITSINSGGSTQQSTASIQAAILKAQAEQRAADEAQIAANAAVAAASANPAGATNLFAGVTPAMLAIGAASGMALLIAVVKN